MEAVIAFLQALLAVDPVLLQLGPLAIRWYALAYVAGILLGYLYVKKLDAHRAPPLLPDDKARDDLMLYAVLGILLGGRLGYVLFYNAPYYFANPGEILAIWQGGMAFHGGLLGVIVAFYLFARKRGIPYLGLMDRIACATPIGLFFGRIANFINGELYGRVTDASIGIVFPGGGPAPRHPSQLYEAALEGALLYGLLWWLWHKTGAARMPGLLAGVFLIGYGLSRAFVELFREPDAQLGFLLGPVTMGQLLCLPMLAVGGYLAIQARKSHYSPH